MTCTASLDRLHIILKKHTHTHRLTQEETQSQMKCTRHYVAFLNRNRSSLFPRNHRRVLIHDMQMIMFTCCYLPPMLFSTVGWRLWQKAFRFTASPLDLPSTFSAQQCDTLVVANILTELSSGKHWERVSLPLFPLQENKLEITIR